MTETELNNLLKTVALPDEAARAAAHAPGGYEIRPYGRGRRPRRPADVHRTANVK